MEFMQFIRQCEKCGYLHYWKLELTEDFKKKVVEQVATDLNARIVE